MMNLKRARYLIAAVAIGMFAATVAVDHADARRGGGFGSRGMRTFQAPQATPTAPRPARPIERSTTTREQASPAAASAARPAATPQGRGMFGGMGGAILGGLVAGGLLGMLFGSGFGGLAGMMGLLLQVGIILVAVMLVRRWLAARSQPAPATAGGKPGGDFQFARSGLGMAGSTPAKDPGARSAGGMSAHDLVGITPKDLDVFEQRLIQVQSAFAREDYAALRMLGTPEVMSYFAEELSQNATKGLRNEVSDIKLLSGDLSEAWSEGDKDYATVAMRYEFRDVMRDRVTGEVREGDPEEMVELTEIWTFVRERHGDWTLSAIQDA